jgi:uncharacterized protein YndB with AHSA1/START domain
MERTRFVYVAYIASSPGKVWNALIDPQLTAKYWQHENVSDWKQGSRWEHRRCDSKKTLDLVGRVIASVPPRRLVLSWADPADEKNEENHSRITIDIAPFREVVRLTLDHEGLEPGSEMLEGITQGWPMVVSSLKSLLETGRALPVLWDMPVEEPAATR